MRAGIELVPVSLPELVVARMERDQDYVGLKAVYTIGRIERGRSEFWTRGRAWRGAPGSIVLQQPGDVHRDIARDGPMTYQLIRLPDDVEPLFRGVRLHSCLDADDPRGAAFQRLHDAVLRRADRLTLECLYTEAIAALGGIGGSRSEHTRPVRRALEMIHDRLAEAWTLDELARHAGLDKFHLCRAFRSQVGLPPHAYRTQLRIREAKALLSAGVRPRDIAPRVGLYDQSQLNRHFRRIVGMTPGEFVRAR
ncbi:MAG: AraC family transcriptional regulator [Nannocystaceae bacterium]